MFTYHTPDQQLTPDYDMITKEISFFNCPCYDIEGDEFNIIVKAEIPKGMDSEDLTRDDIQILEIKGDTHDTKIEFITDDIFDYIFENYPIL